MSVALRIDNYTASASAPADSAAPVNSPRQPSPRCLIIVPAFNEGGSISKLIDRLQRALPEMDVVVIDDGSTDGTAMLAEKRSNIVCLPFNLGIGGAMQTGYRYADLHDYDVAIQVDGDGQHRPCEVRKLVQRLVSGQADLIVGSRFLEQSGYRQHPLRSLGSLILRLTLRLLINRDITDCTSGFRAANRNVIRAFAHWYPEDYPEPEVILLLHRAGYNVEEAPTRMRRRRSGRSSIGSITGIFYVLKVLFCLLLDMARRPWDNNKVRLHP